MITDPKEPVLPPLAGRGAGPASEQRLLSGHAQLDQILGGGLPANGIAIIAGLPGSGKTILAQQYAFHNAASERPAVYLTTVSEPAEKVLRYGQSLSYFDPAAVGSSVIYDDLGELLSGGGLSAVVEHVVAVIKTRRPALIVIDSFKALAAYTDSPLEFRRFLHALAGWLSAFPTACLWVGEYNESDSARCPEFAVADAIIELGSVRTQSRQRRWLRVAKLRGSSFAGGLHTYRISSDGLEVFPRLADQPDRSSYDANPLRRSSGIDALDEMLLDGYWEGSSTMCAGPSGAGKTLMGLHFIFNGARQGEPGVIASMQENETQLQRVVGGFGWSLEERSVETMYRSPVDIHIDEWAYELLDTIDRVGAKRVLIDSLTDLLFAASEELRHREYLYSLTQRLSRQGVSLFMTSEIPDLFNIDRLSEIGISHLSDNLIVLQYVRSNATINRSLVVLKTRAGRHEPDIRQFTITEHGIHLQPHSAPGDRDPGSIPFHDVQRWNETQVNSQG
ncbi:MAG: RAD55 family ATPase [Solirubrobacteraceae bacterium]